MVTSGAVTKRVDRLEAQGYVTRTVSMDVPLSSRQAVRLHAGYDDFASFPKDDNFNRFGRVYRVMMQAEPQYRNQPSDVTGIYVRTSRGEMVPLSTLVSTERGTGPDIIQRFNLFRAAEVTGSPAEGYSSGQALEALAPRAAHYAAHLEVAAPQVTLSNARTQWGVCTEGGSIRLSWRLVHLEPGLADYVVAHEVAHLVELNHSKRFWSLLAKLYPDWREARQRLELAGASLPIIHQATS